MTPDPEHETAMRERVQALLAAAPEPDPARLADGLQAARSANRRREKERRTMVWVAGAVLLGAGVATAGWWAGSGESRSDGSTKSVPETSSVPAAGGESSANEDDQRRSGSGGTDSGLIYQGAE